MSSLHPELANALAGIFATHATPEQAPAGQEASVSSTGPATGIEGALGHVQEGKQEAAAFGTAAMQAENAGAEAGLKAADAREAVDTKVAEEKKPIYQQILERQQKFDTDFDAAQKKITERTEASYDNYLQAVNDYKDTHVHTWYSEASTGAKMLGFVSQALFGALEGLTGRPGGQSPLDKVIDDDYRQQSANLAQKGQRAGQAQGLYAELKARLKDEVSVQGALRDIAYQSFLKQLDNVAAANGTEEVKAKAKAVRAQIMQDYGTHRSNTLLQLGTQAQHAELAAAGITESYDAMWKAHEAKPAEPKAGISGVQGSQYLDTETKGKLGERTQLFKSMLENTDRVIQSIVSPQPGPDGKEPNFADRAADVAQALQAIKFMAPTAFGDRASVELLKHVDELVGTTGAYMDKWKPGTSNAAILKRLENFKTIIKASRKNAIEGQAVDPGTGILQPLKMDEEKN